MISSAIVFRSYLVNLAVATAVAACLIVVALFVVDPYGLYPAIPGLSPARSSDLFWHGLTATENGAVLEVCHWVVLPDGRL